MDRATRERYRNRVPPIRKHRRATIILTLVFLALFVVLLVIVNNMFDKEEEPPITPLQPIHVITMEPQPTPEPTAEVFPAVPMDTALKAWIVDRSEENGIDPALVFSVMNVETHGTFDANATGALGEIGLMQIMPTVHTDRCIRLDAYNLYDPYQNAIVGIDLLAELIGYGNGVEWALTVYNAGWATANEYAERGELWPYTEKVLTIADEYRSEVVDNGLDK